VAFGLGLVTLGALLFTWSMIALAFIDLDTFYLPDDITLPLLWAGLLFNLGGVFTDLQSAVIGAIGAILSYGRCSGYSSSRPARKAWVTATSSCWPRSAAWLGWKMLPQVILLSSLVGAVIGISLIVLARHGRNVPIPFGPYLAVAGLIALLYGDAINKHYLALF